MFVIRTLVALAIMLPYWAIRQPHDTVEMFAVAFVAFAAGRIAATAVAKRRARTAERGALPPPR